MHEAISIGNNEPFHLREPAKTSAVVSPFMVIWTRKLSFFQFRHKQNTEAEESRRLDSEIKTTIYFYTEQRVWGANKAQKLVLCWMLVVYR